MKIPRLLPSPALAGFVALAMLAFAHSASAVLIVTTAEQNPGTSSFNPTWNVGTNNDLILGLTPTSSAGNFTSEANTPGLSALTDGIIGPVSSSLNIYAAGGNSAGTQVIYTLPATNALGYNITNITVYSGWANGGRVAQAWTVLYSTTANPGNFIFLTNLTYTDGFGGNNPGTPVTYQVMLSDSAGGPIAANVNEIEFIFNFPVAANGENSGTGYSEITVQGVPATNGPTFAFSATSSLGTTGGSVQGAAGTYFIPSFVEETPNLLAGVAPSTVGSGNFTEELVGRNPNSLTMGGSLGLTNVEVAAGNTTTTSTNYVTCGGGAGGASLIYTLPTNMIGSGVSLTNIVVYNGWANNGRDGQYFTVSYSSVLAPTTFIPIGTVYYLPTVPANTFVANRTAFSALTAPLATNAAFVQFNFATPLQASSFNNGYQGYAQLIVQGTNSPSPTAPPSPYLIQDTLPASAIAVVGDAINLTAAFSNSPPAILQWQQVVGGVTNLVGVPFSTPNTIGNSTNTLTLLNLQVSNTGSYQLQALNATNNAGSSYSSPISLIVNPLPAATGNLIIADASQTGWGGGGNIGTSTNFYPSWFVNTNTDLIFGFTEENGQVMDGGGNFDAGGPGGAGLVLVDALTTNSFADPDLLSDGTPGYFTYWPGVGTSPTEVSCGINEGASVTYYLGAGSNNTGFDITNIAVYGGWGDDGRNEQKYTVLYSTVANPGTFSTLAVVDYNPTTTSGTQSATRTTITPVTSPLAHNVAYIEFDFLFTSYPKNGWEGYSEITVGGQSSPGTPVPVLTQDMTPLTAEDVVGSQITMLAAFTGATSYQWQQNGTNIPGATSPSLTLSHLATNNAGSYSLLAINSGGTNITSTCVVTVDPAPAAVSNVISSFAFQTSDAVSFSPTWDPTQIDSAANLILGQNPPAGGYGTGDFDDPNASTYGEAGGTYVLTDGSYGTVYNDGTHYAFATCGPTAGQFVEYLMPDGGALGDDITNIQIAGGWSDAGRDAQYYTILYSYVNAPTTFFPLTSVKIQPADPLNDYSVARATFTPASGLLARNVYAIYVDFTAPTGVPNGYSGYSEISVLGSPSTTQPPPVLVLETNMSPLLSDVPVGAPMSFSVAVASSAQVYYQWSNQSGAISGATNSTYSFNALPGTNSYYVGVSSPPTVVTSATAVVIGETTAPPVVTIGNGTNWTFNEAAGTGFEPYVVSNNTIQLTTTAGSQATSVFYDVGQYVGGFVAGFWYQDASVAGADGVTFCLQNSAAGLSAVGAAGGSLGYAVIAPSAAVELNIYIHTYIGTGGNTAGPGIQFGVDGAVDSTTNGLSSTLPVNIASGDFIYVQLYYLNGNLQVWLDDPMAGAEFTTNYVTNLPAIVGNGSSYIGFTGADGGLSADQYVLDFSYSYTTPPNLSIAPGAPGYVELTWPVSVASFFQLQQTTNLAGPWTVAATAPYPLAPGGGYNQVTVATTNSAATFYKLSLAVPNAPPFVP